MSHSSTPPSMRQIIEELKQYFSLQYEWIKLDGIEKLTRIISALIILTLSIILISIVTSYICRCRPYTISNPIQESWLPTP